MITKEKKLKKESKHNVFFSILLGILLFTVIGYLVTANMKASRQRTEYSAKLETLQMELYDLEAKKQQLQAQISQTSQESYLEQEARERFNLKKPGEEVVAVLPAEEAEGKSVERSFWQKIIDKIKFW